VKSLNEIYIPAAELYSRAVFVSELDDDSNEYLGESTKRISLQSAPFDIVEYISEKTRLSYPDLMKIFLCYNKHAEIAKNPVKWAQEAINRIKTKEFESMATIRYNKTGESYTIEQVLKYDIPRLGKRIIKTPERGLL
jgi:hypothetical protein